MTSLTPAEKYNIISRNLQEVLGKQQIETILAERDLNIYWGTAPTGKPHLGYFVPMTKIADFLEAGCHITVLIADIHAFLDNMKAPMELVGKRAEYYTELIKATLTSIGVPTEKLKFVQGSSYQLTAEYALANMKMCSRTTEREAKKAGAEVVKQVESPLLSGLMYPGMQALDEEFLGVDAQFGGVDQRKIFVLAEKMLPILGYKKRSHLMNTMVPGLAGPKMSSSDPDSKIDLLEAPEDVKRKLSKAFCEEGNITDNGILAFVKTVLFPLRSMNGKNPTFSILRPEKFGGDVIYTNYEDLENDFKDMKVHPGDLKKAVTDAINELLAPIRKWFDTDELRKLTEEAYPTPKPEPKAKPVKSNKSAANANTTVDISRVDIRVARIIEAKVHHANPNSYISTVDCGDGDVRSVVSGLAKYIPLEDMQNRLVCAVCNLKPGNFQGVLSSAMLLAGSNADGSVIELLQPPAGLEAGDLIEFEGYAQVDRSSPEKLNPKHLIFEKISEDFKISSEGHALYKDLQFKTKAGPVTLKSLKDGRILRPILSSIMSIRLLSSLRPVLRSASANVAVFSRFVPRSAAPAVSSTRTFPALTSYIQQSSGFHTYSTRLQAVNQEALKEQHEDELPTRFDEIRSLHPNTAKAIKSVFKYETMSKVQSEVLSLLPTDADMFVKAKTGTGKTLAFLIPAIETIVSKTDSKTLKRGDMATCLIVSPTRELAQQIAEEAKKLVSPHRFNVHCLVGGESKGQQIRKLNTKRVDIIVGTPGRLNDMIETVSEFRPMLEGVKTLILDEADQLLDMGFKDSIESIVEALPRERQTLFFSATVSPQIKSIARTSLKPNFTFIDTVDPNEANTNLQVNQSYAITTYEQQLPLLTRIIDEHKQSNPNGKVMVFLPTTRGTQLYAALFEELTNYRLFSLHSKKSQEQRTRTSDRFRKSRGSIMFTSDVSARGVDYPDVSLVIQVGIPSSKEQYIHRVGRTGRAGKTGEGVLMITPMERSFLDVMSDLPLTVNETSKDITEIMKDEKLMDKLTTAKQAQDPEMINDAFTAYLGYYTGRTDVLSCPKRDILESAKQYIVNLGADEPPHLSESFLAKLGFNSRGGGSFRGGNSRGGFSRGGFSRGGDSYSRDSRGRSSSKYGDRNNDRGGRYDRPRNDRTDRNTRFASDGFFSRD
ncbi:hypothetical protein BGZ46_009653 [Entomortierella lignicola]|nr:hypothetical protein BGZ46_009653 [Entomortierella lignicola]